MEWIDYKTQKPPHMKKVKAWIGNPENGFEREAHAVFLNFDGEGDFYDSEEQESLFNVTRWKYIE